MNKLNHLPEITEKSLGGLEAGLQLKLRILNNIQRPAQRFSPMRVAIPALACAVVVGITSLVFVSKINQPAAPDSGIITIAAGNSTQTPLLTADSGIGGGQVAKKETNISPNSVWDKNTNLICINGRWYRMLKGGSSKAANKLGSPIGTVEEKVSDPALADTGKIISSICDAGTEVYGVKNMSDTLVACTVNGKTRFFQRVAFNGTALLGNESLSDTLQIASHATALTLSDVGTITDQNAISSLLNMLFSSASYESSAALSSGRYLQIKLDNGATVQMVVKNNSLSACGTWSCPDFFTEFENNLD